VWRSHHGGHRMDSKAVSFEIGEPGIFVVTGGEKAGPS